MLRMNTRRPSSSGEWKCRIRTSEQPPNSEIRFISTHDKVSRSRIYFTGSLARADPQTLQLRVIMFIFAVSTFWWVHTLGSWTTPGIRCRLPTSDTSPSEIFPSEITFLDFRAQKMYFYIFCAQKIYSWISKPRKYLRRFLSWEIILHFSNDPTSKWIISSFVWKLLTSPNADRGRWFLRIRTISRQWLFSDACFACTNWTFLLLRFHFHINAKCLCTGK